MYQQITLFWTALAFFTRIPCTRWAGTEAEDFKQAVRYLPLVGVLVGGFAAIIFMLAAQTVPQAIAILLSMVGTLLLTGALHEDGLADSADGLGGGWNQEQILNIMKDSRIGSYGAIALFMILFSKFQILSALDSALLPVVLIAGHASSRLSAVLVIASQDYVRQSGKAQAFAQRINGSALALAAVSGLLPVLWLPVKIWWALLGVALVWLGFSHKLRQQLGGYTGDCLGAMQQLTEIAFYLGVLACSSI